MTEAEILFPVHCPICAQNALTGFRISVVADALGDSGIGGAPLIPPALTTSHRPSSTSIASFGCVPEGGFLDDTVGPSRALLPRKPSQ